MKTFIETITRETPMLRIQYEQDPWNPREGTDGTTRLVIREHRRYDFENELPELDLNEPDQTLLAPYYVFELDFYEHSGMSFSLHGIGALDRFDTSTRVGYMLVQREGRTEDEARALAIHELEWYNAYVNGEVYAYTLFDNEGEIVDSCGGFHDLDAIKDNLPPEWKDEDMAQYFI